MHIRSNSNNKNHSYKKIFTECQIIFKKKKMPKLKTKIIRNSNKNKSIHLCLRKKKTTNRIKFESILLTITKYNKEVTKQKKNTLKSYYL